MSHQLRFPRRHPDTATQPITEGLLVHDRRNARVHVLNQTGAFVYERCDGSHDVEMIARELAQRFPVDVAQVRLDVEKLVVEFIDNGIIAETAA